MSMLTVLHSQLSTFQAASNKMAGNLCKHRILLLVIGIIFTTAVLCAELLHPGIFFEKRSLNLLSDVAKFSRTERSLKDHCLAVLVDKGGITTVTSPDYPSNYSNNRDCQWLLTTQEESSKISINIDTLMIESDKHCRSDYLEIFMGSSIAAPLLGTFCGNISNQIIETNSSTVLLVFHTDESVTDKGFSIDYYTQDTKVCPKLFEEEFNSFTSPGFPQNYPDDTDCSTLIQLSSDKNIILIFDYVDLQEDANCSLDYVQVFDGNSTTSTLLGKMCHETSVRSFDSSSNTMLVNFHSDNSINRKGFRARYTATDGRFYPKGNCVWVSSVVNGTITSPNYPQDYPSHEHCTIWILSAIGSRINFTFEEISLQTDANCSSDFLQIKEGSLPESKVLGTFCGGSSEPTHLISTKNEVQIEFKSDDSIQNKGFVVHYEILQRKSGCNATFVTEADEFASPNYPMYYPDNIKCHTLINATEGKYIILTFDNLDLEYSENCTGDYVQVFDGKDTGAPLLGQICHETDIRKFESSSNYMLIMFHSDDSISRPGYAASYRTEQLQSYLIGDCMWQNYNKRGILTSPNYPKKYPKSTYCRLRVLMQDLKACRITFEFIQLEKEPNCSYDYLEISERSFPDSNVLGRFCGLKSETRQLIMRGKELLIEFHTDSTVELEGFQLRYEFLQPSTACQRMLMESSHAFTSPGFPFTYPENFDCQTIIASSEDRFIVLTFDSVELDGPDDCSKDYVEVFDGGDSDSPPLTKICRVHSQVKLQSSNNTLMVHFHSSRRSLHGSPIGFRARYVSVKKPVTSNVGECVWTEAENMGNIQSPNFPDDYPHNALCNILVTAPEEYRIFILIHKTAIEKNDNCTYDFLGIREADSKTMRLFCGRFDMVPVYTQGNEVQIVFKSDHSNTGEGFHLEYRFFQNKAECPWEIGENNGTITSPNYPDRYPKFTNCTIRIQAPAEANRIYIIIDDMDLQPNDSCPYDFVQVTEISKSGNSILGKLCSRTSEPRSFVSTERKVEINFVSDLYTELRGFKLRYSFLNVEKECGQAKTAQPLKNFARNTFRKDSEKGAYPWHVMLSEPHRESFCGATLLNERWIITAAHCFVGVQGEVVPWHRVTIKLGKYDWEHEEQQEIRARISDQSSIVVHPDFNRRTLDNDLALVKMKDTVMYGDYVQPICLGNSYMGEALVNADFKCSSTVAEGAVVGWGTNLHENSPGYLKEKVMPIVDRKTCSNSTRYKVTPNTFCAGYSRTATNYSCSSNCASDSGTSFIVSVDDRWYLVGLNNWIESYAPENNYEFYTLVPNYVDWIRSVIGR